MRNDIWTSKSGPSMVCFAHFGFEMCFAPQRRALFDISTSKSGPSMVCFVHVDFEMCFAPQRHGVHFFDISTSKSGPRMVCFVHVDFEMCFAPQRHGVHFLDISTSKSGPRMVCFVHVDFEMCFAPQRRAFFNLSSGQLALHPPLYDPPEPQIIGKTQCFATFLPFRAPVSSFFWLFLWSSLFYSSLLSDSSHLCFSSVHIVGSLTSKLPSIRWHYCRCISHIPIDAYRTFIIRKFRTPRRTRRNATWWSTRARSNTYNLILHKMIPWVKRLSIFGKQKIHQMRIM